MNDMSECFYNAKEVAIMLVNSTWTRHEVKTINTRNPVLSVTWHDTQLLIKSLNAKSITNYRLPTEAEWEYAARSGGEKGKYSGSGSLNKVGWNKFNASNHGGNSFFPIPHRVGTKNANGLGIYDMTRNTWECCQDWYDENYYVASPKMIHQVPSMLFIRPGEAVAIIKTLIV